MHLQSMHPYIQNERVSCAPYSPGSCNIYVCVYTCMYVCMYVCVYTSRHVFMVCVCLCTYIYIYTCTHKYMRMYICMYLCMNVCIYIHTCEPRHSDFLLNHAHQLPKHKIHTYEEYTYACTRVLFQPGCLSHVSFVVPGHGACHAYLGRVGRAVGHVCTKCLCSSIV